MPTKKVRRTSQPTETSILIEPVIHKRNIAPLEPKTEAQRHYISTINRCDIIFGTGEAGSGKTYVATSMACEALVSKSIDRIIITRPAQEAGESMGFLPGELEAKFEPYLRPLADIFEERLGKGFYRLLVKSGKIEAMPIAYLRGVTFDNAWVLVDEAQNLTPKQMQMLLTRIGENTKMIISGDIKQSDIRGPTGLGDGLYTIGDLPGVGHIDFDVDDVVRSGMCRAITRAYAERTPQ